MKKKILFLDQNLDGGGAERVMCTIMRTLPPDKFDLHLVLIDRLGQLGDLVPGQVLIHELGISHTRNALFSFRKKLLEISPDIVYSTLHNATVLSILSRLGRKHKIIARYPNTPSSENATGRYVGWRTFLMKLLYRNADIIISQTDEMAEEIKTCYKIGKDRIRTILNPVDHSLIDNSLSNVADPYNNDKINIMASGKITEQKGFDVLIAAFYEVKRKSQEQYFLNIIGVDVAGNRLRLENKIKELGLEKDVRFWGFQKNPYPFYKFCDLFILSSKWEGLPNVLLECQYLGKPVVATRCVPVVERLIDHGKNGYVVPVDDVAAIADAILNYGKLTPQVIKRDTASQFAEIFNEA